MGYSFRVTARVLLYAPSHRQDSTRASRILYSGQMHMASEIQTWVTKYLQNYKFNLQSGQQIFKSIALGQVKFGKIL